MTRWEYIHVVLPLDDIRDRLGALGEKGWEMTGVSSGIYYFKRPLPSPTSPIGKE